MKKEKQGKGNRKRSKETNLNALALKDRVSRRSVCASEDEVNRKETPLPDDKKNQAIKLEQGS